MHSSQTPFLFLVSCFFPDSPALCPLLPRHLLHSLPSNKMINPILKRPRRHAEAGRTASVVSSLLRFARRRGSSGRGMNRIGSQQNTLVLNHTSLTRHPPIYPVATRSTTLQPSTPYTILKNFKGYTHASLNSLILESQEPLKFSLEHSERFSSINWACSLRQVLRERESKGSVARR